MSAAASHGTFTYPQLTPIPASRAPKVGGRGSMLRSHDAAGINWSYVQSPKRALSGARVGAEERATPRDACIRLGYHPGRAKLPKTRPCGVSGKLWWIASVTFLSVPVAVQ